MQISWKDFLKRKLYKPSSQNAIGLAYTADQVLLCTLKQSKDGIAWSLDATFSHNNWQQKLHSFVKENKLQGAACYFALTAHWYKLLQIDKPDVPSEEVFAALQWPLQEVIGAQQDITYDYIDLPVKVSGYNKVLAVAIAKKDIENISEAIFDAGLFLQTITVEEFATLNLLPKSSEAIITLIQEQGEELVINIIKDGHLYFSRKLKGFENIGSFTEQELEMGVLDSLGVQVQRSMDYFESQLRQPPVNRILMKLDTRHDQYVAEKITTAMGVKCELFVPDITLDNELNLQMASFSCLGAAMAHFRLKEDIGEEVEVTN
ncbi:MAG: biogenesis protein MshI [Pseudomonadota bacterium]